jgi:plastocyanin
MKGVEKVAGLIVAVAASFAVGASLQIGFAKAPTAAHAGPAAVTTGVPDARGVRAAAWTTAEVKIDNFTFTPVVLTVPVGAQVTWTNRDDIPHTVVSDDQAIKSKPLDTDDKFTFTFSKAGTYTYFCSLHPKMKGRVVVQ